MSVPALLEPREIGSVCCCFIGNLMLAYRPFVLGFKALLQAHSDGSICACDAEILYGMLDEAALRLKRGGAQAGGNPPNPKLAEKVAHASEVVRSMYN